MLYFSFIYPHLLYGIEIYANCSHTTLQSLHVLNNRILRVLLNKPVRSPVNELYINFDTLPLHLLFEKQVLIFVHKCLFNNQVLPEIFHNYFNRRYMIHEHNTRKKSNLNIPIVSTNIGQRRMTCIGAKLWNNLPEDLKICSYINMFKKSIKNLLSSKLL